MTYINVIIRHLLVFKKKNSNPFGTHNGEDKANILHQAKLCYDEYLLKICILNTAQLNMVNDNNFEIGKLFLKM